MPDLIDPFHRKLYGVLSKDIESRMALLASGSATAIQGAVETVAEKYAAQVSYIKALNDVLDKCHELEVDMYGARDGDAK